MLGTDVDGVSVHLTYFKNYRKHKAYMDRIRYGIEVYVVRLDQFIDILNYIERPLNPCLIILVQYGISYFTPKTLPPLII